MFQILTLFYSISIIMLTYFVLRGTILDIKYPIRNPWALLWYVDILLVLIPINIVNFVGVANISVIYTKLPQIEIIVSLWVLVTLTTLTIFLSLFLRYFKLYSCLLRKITQISQYTLMQLHSFASSLIFLGIVLLITFYFLNYKHAFLFSLIEGKPLLVIRLANKYFARVPSQIASILPLVGYLLAGVAGILSYQGRTKSLFYLLFALFFLTASGGKAPPLKGVLIWALAQQAVMPQRLWSMKSLYLLLLGVVLLLVFYPVVVLQMPNLDFQDYLIYLFNRLGVGQMAGMFETIGLAQTQSLPEGTFYWHTIPGAHFFVDYIDYQKALMMTVEGYSYTTMGVKNTYFVAEAYAIGGKSLAIFSPIIVAFSLSFSLMILLKFFQRIFSKEISPYFAILVWSQSFSITGGFASFPLFKGLILTLIQLTVIFIVYSIFRKTTFYLRVMLSTS